MRNPRLVKLLSKISPEEKKRIDLKIKNFIKMKTIEDFKEGDVLYEDTLLGLGYDFKKSRRRSKQRPC